MSPEHITALLAGLAALVGALVPLVSAMRGASPGQAPDPPERLDTPSTGLSAGELRVAQKHSPRVPVQ